MTEAATTVSLVIALLASSQFNNEVLWMARAMEGETGGVMGDPQEAMEWIGHVILNRKQPRETIEDVVRNGFFGHDKAVNPKRMTDLLARSIILNRGLSGHDPTGGMIYMLSFHDLAKMGLPLTGDRCFEGIGGFGLCFFKEWPGG